MNTFLKNVKAVFLIGFFLLGLFGFILYLMGVLTITRPENQRTVKFRIRKKFCRFSNWIFGVRLHTVGNIPDHGTYLFVSNHRSFYDPIAFLSVSIANPVSKAEISSYPLIGWGSRLTEVILVDRNSRIQRGKTKEVITRSLLDGLNILIYPEGTTSDAEYTAEFKKGAFGSASTAGVGIIPVAIEYQYANQYWTARSLYQQFVHQFASNGKTDIYMSVGDPVYEDNPVIALRETQGTIEDHIRLLREYRKRYE